MDPSLFFQKTVSFSKKENEVITIRAFKQGKFNLLSLLLFLLLLLLSLLL